MNIGDKGGYHWKYIGKDPGQQSLKQGGFNRTARADGPNRPSGLQNIHTTVRRVFRLLGEVTYLFETWGRSLEPWDSFG